ncbi:MAG: amino acid adenylation domain-containing protein, partial [Chitinophagia bacterium]|nr:amino acid adenylation domain-containing protein [Chitinophagia bacterium]
MTEMVKYTPVEHNPFEQEREIEKIVPTNEPQREIWLACAIGYEAANLSYNESVTLKMTGILQVPYLQQALALLVARHESLRATVSPNGEWLMVYRNLPATIEVASLTPDQDPEQAIAAFATLQANTPMHLQNGPLFKAYIHTTESGAHYLTLVKHHIIGDGWSTGIMLEDLSRMYNQLCEGQQAQLPAAQQASDYIHNETAFRHSADYRKTYDYWLKVYENGTPQLEMPTDRPRPAQRTYEANRLDFPVNAATTTSIKQAGAKLGCSLVTTLLGAFEVLLYQATRQQQLVVGLPAAGQAATGLTGVVGHCVNLLPLKTTITPETGFNDYLKRRKKEVLDAYDHQRITFGELLKRLYVARDPSRIPLVPVLFNIDMGMDNAVRFNDISFELTSNPRAYENFEIYLNITGSQKGLLLEWSYNRNLFDATTIAALNERYTALLHQIVAAPSTTIEALVGFTQQLSVARGRSFDITGQTFLQLFHAAAARYSAKDAIICNSEHYTYYQLQQLANHAAMALVQAGLRPGDIVAVAVNRSPGMLVAQLAVWTAGGTYLPIDPEYPANRISYMLADSGAAILITSPGSMVAAAGVTALHISEQGVVPQTEAAIPSKIDLPIKPGEIAYLLYTSGSTGQPKGVQVTHSNLVNFLLSMLQEPGIGEHDRLLAITSVSFDIAALELYLPLMAGATIIIADLETARDGRQLLDVMQHKGVTLMQGTPSTWQMLIDAGWEKPLPVRVLSGGEPLSPTLASQLMARSKEVWNLYGPTETTVWSTIKKLSNPTAAITVGQPIFNTSIYIADSNGSILPIGETGEITIGGAGVAQGYWQREQLTAEKFKQCGQQPSGMERCYFTGDLGKLSPDGELTCMGRIDHQVKIRGHRIELGEIESALTNIEGIKQAVVVAREDQPGDKRLAAYVTLNENDGETGNGTWKDRWDTLYQIGAEARVQQGDEASGIDGTLLENLTNKEELTLQLAEWLETTIARIRTIKCSRIYEIGSGAGQVMFGLAPHVQYYMATDYAAVAIENIQTRLKALNNLSHVATAVAAADDFTPIAGKTVDLIIINSVAQYFPDSEYLLKVIGNAVNALSKGGCLFIGDMQGKNTLEMHHAMEQLNRSEGNVTLQQFREVVANRVRIEEELTADPPFFYLLPRLFPSIKCVDIQLRRGQSVNETTKYHY